MEISEKRKKLETLPWQALFDVAIEENIEEAEMIDRLIRAFDSKPAVDVLNLTETADLLRVSNQTVYNMIREGRVKAYKAGREWRILRSDMVLISNATIL